MVYELEISEEADKKFRKLSKKNKKQLEIINKKVNEILKQPGHYKPLRGVCMELEESTLINTLF